MSARLATLDRRRAVVELAMLTAMGLIVGVLGPFGTDALPPLTRHVYWLLSIVGGGVIGVAVDALLATRIAQPWRRLALTVLVMTPLVTLYIFVLSGLVFGQQRRMVDVWLLAWQVFVISLAVMTARAFVWREPRRVVEVRTVVAPPLPEAEAAFRRRLSAKRRGARLIAVEAYDHYLRVHTDAGEELVTARFADALAELAGAHGLRIHRSWWVAGDAIEGVTWRRGTGEARLAGGLTAPVSRSHAPRAAGGGLVLDHDAGVAVRRPGRAVGRRGCGPSGGPSGSAPVREAGSIGRPSRRSCLRGRAPRERSAGRR